VQRRQLVTNKKAFQECVRMRREGEDQSSAKANASTLHPMSASGTTLHPLPFYEPLRPEIFEVKKKKKNKNKFCI
jgi:hypothetical protein